MDHRIYLIRRIRSAVSTIGTFDQSDGRHIAYACEDVVREPEDGHPATSDHFALDAWVRKWKVKGRTAIPTGVYRLAWTRSNRFKRMMFEVLGVPGFGGVRIHAGNTHIDTEGCPLTGSSIVNNAEVRGSLVALEKLQRLVVPLIEAGDAVYLHVENHFGEMRSPA